MINAYPFTKREPNRFCSSIKLTDIQYIQAYGCLLAVDANFRIISYSENMRSFLQTEIQDILNQSILNYLKSPQESEDMEFWLKNANKTYKDLIWQSPTKKINLSATVHQIQGLIILEFELMQEKMNHISQVSSTDMYSPCNSIQEIGQLICNDIKESTHYNRIMLYQIDSDSGVGLVIAEALEENMDSFLGMHFPADDIPQVVRDMYLVSPIRYIPSILQKPIPIVNANETMTQYSLNMSEINLRGLVPIHMQYLINMKVVSSTSIAVIVDDQLWGLIICHHKEPKYLPVNLRYELIEISKLLASQILVRELEREHQEQQRAKELQTMLSELLNDEISLINAFDLYHGKIIDLMAASGMTIYFQNKVLSYGATPAEAEMHHLIAWLDKQDFAIMETSSIVTYDPALRLHHKDKVCGLLVLKIKEPQTCYIIFYRPEHLYTIKWGGDPNYLLKMNQESYSPRNSFNPYIETIDKHSLPWTNNELKSAEFIRAIAIDILHTQGSGAAY